VNNLQRDVRDNQLFRFDDAAATKLQENGFVILPAEYAANRFDKAYEALRMNETPILVTTDSTYHLFHIFFDQILKNIEVREFIPMFRAMLPELAFSPASLYEALDGNLKEAALK